MNNEYKTFEELKEELGDKFELFMYKANIELLDKVNQLEEEKANINKKYERLLFQTNVCIRFIKEGNKTKKTESCKYYHHRDFTNILEILKRGKE